MRKIVMIITAVFIPVIAACGMFYFVGEKNKQEDVHNVLNKINHAPYIGLATKCTYDDPQMQTCCIGSVYDMQQMNGLLSTSELCVGVSVNVPECPGAYTWCIPIDESINQEKQDTPISSGNKTCAIDTDCVPATCCHPTEVINKELAPDCSAVLCTMSCETILDCGQGEPVCKNNICEIDVK